jgi:hypothetical protein
LFLPEVERWDTWTNAKVVIGKSNGAGANKTEFKTIGTKAALLLVFMTNIR